MSNKKAHLILQKLKLKHRRNKIFRAKMIITKQSESYA